LQHFDYTIIFLIMQVSNENLHIVKKYSHSHEKSLKIRAFYDNR